MYTKDTLDVIDCIFRNNTATDGGDATPHQMFEVIRSLVDRNLTMVRSARTLSPLHGGQIEDQPLSRGPTGNVASSLFRFGKAQEKVDLQVEACGADTGTNCDTVPSPDHSLLQVSINFLQRVGTGLSMSLASTRSYSSSDPEVNSTDLC